MDGNTKHGLGKWSNILKDHQFKDVLQWLSNVHLKDKRRNICVTESRLRSRTKIKRSADIAKTAQKNDSDDEEYHGENVAIPSKTSIIDDDGDMLIVKSDASPFSTGHSFYSTAELDRNQPLGDGLESRRCGFYQSIQPTEMNIDMSSSTTFIATQILNRDLTGSDSHRLKVVKKALGGVKVEVTHRGNMHCISGLTFLVAKHGTVKHVAQETYGFVILWPCLQLEKTKEVNEKQITALLKDRCQWNMLAKNKRMVNSGSSRILP